MSDELMPNTPEYEQAMIDKAERGLHSESLESFNEETSAEVKQDNDAKIKLLAGKYKSQEDLERGILELVKREAGEDLEGYYKKLEGGLGATKTPAKTADKTPDEAAPETDKDAPKDTQFSNDLFSSLNDEFASNNGLTEETVKKLSSAGIPESIIKTHVAGLQALQELNAIKSEIAAAKLYESVGGEDSYNNIKQWAFDNLPESEIQEFNAVVETGNMTAIKLALRGMKAIYDEQNGVKPSKLLTGSISTSRSGDAYTSYKEVTKDMNNPEYKKNPAFRRSVQERLARSNF
jgi:hypothetical protein